LVMFLRVMALDCRLEDQRCSDLEAKLRCLASDLP
jgi:hypothetical protein